MEHETPEILELPERLVACVSYTGNYVGKPEVFVRLFGQLGGWAGPKGLISADSVFLSSYPNSPETTPSDDLRLDVCMTIPDGIEVDDGVEKKVLPGGLYAVMLAELSRAKEFGMAWEELVAWTNRNSHTIDVSRPSYEIYRNNPDDHPQKHHVLEICLSVKTD